MIDSYLWIVLQEKIKLIVAILERKRIESLMAKT